MAIKDGGFEYKFGNDKIKDGTIVYNMGPAHGCPSAKLDLCPIAGQKCYAFRDETTYRHNTLPYRLRQEIYWLGNPAEVFVEKIMKALDHKEKTAAKAKIKHDKAVAAGNAKPGFLPFKRVVRWNESGDFHSLACIDKLKTIAELTPQVTHYIYTHRTDLIEHLVSHPKNLVVQISVGSMEDSVKYNAMGFNTFFTDTTISIKGRTKKLIEGLPAHDWAMKTLKTKYGPSAQVCRWECHKCALCKINHSRTIHICLH